MGYPDACQNSCSANPGGPTSTASPLAAFICNDSSAHRTSAATPQTVQVCLKRLASRQRLSDLCPLTSVTYCPVVTLR